MALGKKGTVRAVETSLRIIDALADLNGASTSQIAAHLNLPKSTVHAHLRTLLENEYVITHQGAYSLALHLFELGQHARSRHEIVTVAIEELERLAERTQEIASLLIEEHGHGVFVYSVNGSTRRRTSSRIGRRVHLHATSSGKAILAHLSKERIHTLVDRHGLEAYTSNTITTRSVLFEELETIRSQGYAVDDEERQTGFFCTGAPVLAETEVLGAISISGPKHRILDSWSVEELAARTTETATNIEFNITGI